MTVDRDALIRGIMKPDAEAQFADWFRKNYPGPDTIIHKPDWHSARIFRAAQAAALDMDALVELVGALDWYREQARLARLIHSEGDVGRHALQADGGKRADAALARIGGRG